MVGDVLQLKYGDLIPADAILIQGSEDFQVDESSFTGESDLMKKSDKDPMLLSGTHVMEGHGKVMVTAVGINSQLGSIFSLLGVAKEESSEAKSKSSAIFAKKSSTEPLDHENSIEVVVVPENGKLEKKEDEAKSDKKDKSILQKKLTKLAVKIGYFGFAVALVTIFILIGQLVYGILLLDQPHDTWPQEVVKYFIIGVTILVVAVPEGLPLAVTISLAYSVKKMMEDNNLVRHLDACETMGNATTICSDKTGTLTTNRMTVVRSYISEKFVANKAEASKLKDDVLQKIAEGISVNTSYTSQVVVSFSKILFTLIVKI